MISALIDSRLTKVCNTRTNKKMQVFPNPDPIVNGKRKLFIKKRKTWKVRSEKETKLWFQFQRIKVKKKGGGRGLTWQIGFHPNEKRCEQQWWRKRMSAGKKNQQWHEQRGGEHGQWPLYPQKELSYLITLNGCWWGSWIYHLRRLWIHTSAYAFVLALFLGFFFSRAPHETLTCPFLYLLDFPFSHAIKVYPF